MEHKRKCTLYYPPDIANDLEHIDLSAHSKEEVLATAWEYTRNVIPQYTNWSRYVAYMRIIVMTIVAEFRGDLVDVLAGDSILNYDLTNVLTALFDGTPYQQQMSRECRASLLIMAEKSSNRRDGELFQRYVCALAHSPRRWHRMRDCDGLARFTIAAALACNDLDDCRFSEDQFKVLAEIGLILYDAVAFFKHRAEGEVHNAFAYLPEHIRVDAYEECRNILWGLDKSYVDERATRHAIDYIRCLGGPIKMTMGRYRFVEDGLRIGIPETEEIVQKARRNDKLWYRMDDNKRTVISAERYEEVLSRSEELLFDGLADFLEENHCDDCVHRESYGAERVHQFGGVKLCDNCTLVWEKDLWTLRSRAARAFEKFSG